MSKPFPPTQGYICYIDESGDEGFRFDMGSSQWFVLSGLVTRQTQDDQITGIVEQLKLKLAWPAAKQLHWKKLRYLEKKLYAEELSRQNVRIVAVAVYKPKLIERENFQERYRLYYYTCRYLLERVSWLVRDAQSNRPEGNGRVGIIFSSRAGMSHYELKNYLEKLKKKSELDQDVRIDWNVLNTDEVRTYPPGRLRGLQLADAVAGIFYNGLETVKTAAHNSEYTDIIAGRLYAHKNSAWGYGLKIVPREAVELLESKKEWEWCRKIKNR